MSLRCNPGPVTKPGFKRCHRIAQFTHPGQSLFYEFSRRDAAPVKGGLTCFYEWDTLRAICRISTETITMNYVALFSVAALAAATVCARPAAYQERENRLVLDSVAQHNGAISWSMKKASDVQACGATLSRTNYVAENWLPAIVPGTVLGSLVYNKVYPAPDYGLNNKKTQKIIPDLNDVGRDFYTYWFRTTVDLPVAYAGKTVWLRADGINYRSEIWINGKLAFCTAGMFCQEFIDVTDYVLPGKANAFAIKVLPVDVAGDTKLKSWGAANNEFRNGGDGEIGKNVTMLMSVGWDFTFNDGVRDRNTGIWRSLSLFTTGKVALRHPFVRSTLAKPNYDVADLTASVEVENPTTASQTIKLIGEIKGTGIRFTYDTTLFRGEIRTITFSPKTHPQLVLKNPRLWWPINKGPQNLYEITFTVQTQDVKTKTYVASDALQSRFGIREITSDQNSPDHSRTFYVNGKRFFVRGTNWIPDALLRADDARMYAELRYTAQSGVNFLRIWGGGIAESDYFFQLCDELGLPVWTEFWLTGDTRHPVDQPLYLKNVAHTVKRIRNHASLAHYVSSNESTEVAGAKELIQQLDPTRCYMMQSECDGVHDGSPYKTVNPMRHYENSASDRGSRVDGFNPEYGMPCLPTVECLREMMDEKDLWPINKEVWDYHDGGGFHLITTLYNDLVNQYGPSANIDDYATKAQAVGGSGFRSIWEVWNANKLDFGDRYCAGLLFWYHNSPLRQTGARMWDWSLEPTAALYFTQDALEPLHAQFDYLSNTVTVVNDYYKAFKGYTVTADVYDFNLKKISSQQKKIDLPEDGLAHKVFALTFPPDITPVHFIKLVLTDDKGAFVSDTFYWRSTNVYQGKKTVTGPCTAGFEDLAKLLPATLKIAHAQRSDATSAHIDVTVENVGTSLAFMTQLQLLDAAQKPVRPTFYTDNFFSLLPGEKRTITLETERATLPSDATLVVKGWNAKPQVRPLK